MSEEEYEKGYEELKSIKKPMKADKMFEKLGYERDKRWIDEAYTKIYEDEEYEGIGSPYSINKVVFMDGKHPFISTNVSGISMELLQAMYQKCKELGWLNE